jgi:hypothetical protein
MCRDKLCQARRAFINDPGEERRPSPSDSKLQRQHTSNSKGKHIRDPFRLLDANHFANRFPPDSLHKHKAASVTPRTSIELQPVIDFSFKWMLISLRLITGLASSAKAMLAAAALRATSA